MSAHVLGKIRMSQQTNAPEVLEDYDKVLRSMEGAGMDDGKLKYTIPRDSVGKQVTATVAPAMGFVDKNYPRYEHRAIHNHLFLTICLTFRFRYMHNETNANKFCTGCTSCRIESSPVQSGANFFMPRYDIRIRYRASQ